MQVRGSEQGVRYQIGGFDWRESSLSSGLIVYSAPLVIVSRRVWAPPTDVYETEDAIVVQLEIPGVNEDDLEISLSGLSLVITGHRRDPLLHEKVAYHRMEIQYGDFETEVCLPIALAHDEIEAVYEDGFLTIRLAKARAHRVIVAAE